MGKPLILRTILVAVADPATPIEIQDVVLLLLGLASVVFVEGWLQVQCRHLLSECLGTPFLASMFSLLVNKTVAMPTATRRPTTKAEQDKDGPAADTDEGEKKNITNLFGNDIMRRFP